MVLWLVDAIVDHFYLPYYMKALCLQTKMIGYRYITTDDFDILLFYSRFLYIMDGYCNTVPYTDICNAASSVLLNKFPSLEGSIISVYHLRNKFKNFKIHCLYLRYMT